MQTLPGWEGSSVRQSVPPVSANQLTHYQSTVLSCLHVFPTIPGQHWSLQLWLWSGDPWQAAPPFWGCVPTVLERDLVPPPHDALQVPQDPQLFHTQSTVVVRGERNDSMKWIHHHHLCHENVYVAKMVICHLHTRACILVASLGFRGWSCASIAAILCRCLAPWTGLGSTATCGAARTPCCPCIPLTINWIVVVVVGWN